MKFNTHTVPEFFRTDDSTEAFGQLRLPVEQIDGGSTRSFLPKLATVHLKPKARPTHVGVKALWHEFVVQ